MRMLVPMPPVKRSRPPAPGSAPNDAESRLTGFIEKFTPEHAAANGVGLCFIQGAKLPDPERVLTGSGKQTRFIRLESAKVLARPEVDSLIAAAIAQSRTPLPAAGRGALIIKSVSAKKRPRRRSP
jgi:hypothetical protein